MMKTILSSAWLLFPIFAHANVQTAVYHPPAASQRVLFNELAKQCAPNVHPHTLQAIARVESGFNPYAIGVVKGALPRQPRNHVEAVSAAKALHAAGKNFSMGLMQVNKFNLPKYGLDYETVFNPCKNLAVGAKILTDCFTRAEAGRITQTALQKAFSCYYSGNFRFGFTQDFPGQPSYVKKVMLAATTNSAEQTIKVPAPDSSVPIAVPAKVSSSLNKTKAAVRVKSSVVEQDANTDKPRSAWDVFADF
ncbi:lytic transglycosylase domain-containing protein [Stenoxybacter acetivorans]|uniref:lytic transglycosylase domain-containing protein n=1 Tax=Stenoxybacter acetivorans TaxID=422441 RepID=UPI0006898320|nr:lytic transglycosylase domain-containing protein [Stenoxybacter acetivorans]